MKSVSPLAREWLRMVLSSIQGLVSHAKVPVPDDGMEVLASHPEALGRLTHIDSGSSGVYKQAGRGRVQN